MSILRSEDYYFPGGDLVLQVQGTLFKVHSDILRRHSGFFEDMLSLPVERTEGLDDERPLCLSQELCSLDAFKKICLFLYPRKISIFPIIFVANLNEWEPVLKASEALQFNNIQEYILSQLQNDTAHIASEPVRLLHWAMRSEPMPQLLALECFYALAYRRRSLSEAEIIMLGSKTTMQVIYIREKLRTSFTSRESLANKLKIRRCERPETCPYVLSKWFIRELSGVDSTNGSDISDIFQLSSAVPPNLCSTCGADATNHVRALRWRGLDDKIHQWAGDVGALAPALKLISFGAS